MTKTTPTPPTGRVCMCGCGAAPRGRRSRFLPGHDARLRGLFVRVGLAELDDATEAERDEAAAEVAALPDVKWAGAWMDRTHRG